MASAIIFLPLLGKKYLFFLKNNLIILFVISLIHLLKNTPHLIDRSRTNNLTLVICKKLNFDHLVIEKIRSNYKLFEFHLIQLIY